MLDHQVALLKLSLDFFEAGWLEVGFQSFPERGLRVGSRGVVLVANVDHGFGEKGAYFMEVAAYLGLRGVSGKESEHLKLNSYNY